MCDRTRVGRLTASMTLAIVNVLPEPVTPSSTWSRRPSLESCDELVDGLLLVSLRRESPSGAGTVRLRRPGPPCRSGAWRPGQGREGFSLAPGRGLTGTGRGEGAVAVGDPGAALEPAAWRKSSVRSRTCSRVISFCEPPTISRERIPSSGSRGTRCSLSAPRNSRVRRVEDRPSPGRVTSAA